MSNQTDLIDFIAELASNDADITLYYYELLRVHPSAEQEVIESALTDAYSGFIIRM